MTEINIKYTKDGKKVAVLGKLNSQEWIVQEIYIANGQEFPAGESFVTKTLLDEPAETYESRTVKELGARKIQISQEIERLEKQQQILRTKPDVAKLVNYAIEKYQKIDPSQLDILFAFMSGRITHVVVVHYSDYEIRSLVDAVEESEQRYGYVHLDGLKLISLFGCNADGERWERDRTFKLTWQINQYKDGSGSWATIHPCQSHEEAIQTLDGLIADKETTESLIKLKAKYKLANPSDAKIAEYRQSCIEAKRKSIQNVQSTLAKHQAELQKMESESSPKERGPCTQVCT